MQARDALLLQLARESGGIEDLLQNIFGFLHRASDFYVVDPSPRRRMGFAPGQAERIVLKAMRRYSFKDTSGRPIAAATAPTTPPRAAAAAAAGSEEAGSAAAGSATVEPAGSASAGSATVESAGSTSAAGSTTAAGSAPAPASPAPPAPAPASASASSDPPSADPSPSSRVRRTREGKQVPVGNGGSAAAGFTWTQTLRDVTLLMPLPGWLKGKDLDVTIGARSLRAEVRRGPASDRADAEGLGRRLLDGGLEGEVLLDGESLWGIERGGSSSPPLLSVVLVKRVETWWERALTGPGTDADAIDTSLVDSTRHVSDYDAETQAAIHKLVHEGRASRGGSPGGAHALPPL